MGRKKAVSLSFETLVVGAIAALVLIFAIMFFTGGFNKIAQAFTKTNDCRQGQGGDCYPANAKPDGYFCSPTGCENDQWCCKAG